MSVGVVDKTTGDPIPTAGMPYMPSYSTVEQKTGQKWIDGKDIYFKTFDLGSDVAFTSSDWINMSSYISISGWDKVIGGSWGFSTAGICVSINTAINAGYLEIRIGFNTTLRYLTIYYTKAT